ncbi:sensor histidine kinase [Konateibacter massiliensis]|uniref:sensor histidine kinase n=1 Tax=Konateibacter massiliensis TaxID=2002841 RepID=UPI000C15575C|nr:histidine kinase [Konateibacter massiliensis]
MNKDMHKKLVEETKKYKTESIPLPRRYSNSQLTEYYSKIIGHLMARLEEENDILRDKRKAEISSLQNQINPHFLYNTLETIRSEALMHGDMDAAMMSESLADYFRYNISKKSDLVTIREELENIESYIRIQKFRFKQRIAYETVYHTEKHLIENAQMPKLILQPLVENSIYHGIEKNINGGKVTVHLFATEKRIIITVWDNGPGMPEEILRKVQEGLRTNKEILESEDRRGGIALSNINQRIQMIYGEEYGLTFSSVKGIGTEAEIVLPRVVKEKAEYDKK